MKELEFLAQWINIAPPQMPTIMKFQNTRVKGLSSRKDGTRCYFKHLASYHWPEHLAQRLRTHVSQQSAWVSDLALTPGFSLMWGRGMTQVFVFLAAHVGQQNWGPAPAVGPPALQTHWRNEPIDGSSVYVCVCVCLSHTLKKSMTSCSSKPKL